MHVCLTSYTKSSKQTRWQSLNERENDQQRSSATPNRDFSSFGTRAKAHTDQGAIVRKDPVDQVLQVSDQQMVKVRWLHELLSSYLKVSAEVISLKTEDHLYVQLSSQGFRYTHWKSSKLKKVPPNDDKRVQTLIQWVAVRMRWPNWWLMNRRYVAVQQCLVSVRYAKRKISMTDSNH